MGFVIDEVGQVWQGRGGELQGLAGLDQVHSLGAPDINPVDPWCGKGGGGGVKKGGWQEAGGKVIWYQSSQDRGVLLSARMAGSGRMGTVSCRASLGSTESMSTALKAPGMYWINPWCGKGGGVV